MDRGGFLWDRLVIFRVFYLQGSVLGARYRRRKILADEVKDRGRYPKEVEKGKVERTVSKDEKMYT